VLALCLFSLMILKDTPWRSGKGEFASIPRRHQRDPVPEEEEQPPVVTTDQAGEDAE